MWHEMVKKNDNERQRCKKKKVSLSFGFLLHLINQSVINQSSINHQSVINQLSFNVDLSMGIKSLFTQSKQAKRQKTKATRKAKKRELERRLKTRQQYIKNGEKRTEIHPRKPYLSLFLFLF
jgi:hypothetical protein